MTKSTKTTKTTKASKYTQVHKSAPVPAQPEQDSMSYSTSDAHKKIKAAQAVKHDTNKPTMSLIPYTALSLEAEVMAYGAKKYDRHNWAKGMEWSRMLDAALRHVTAFAAGEQNDTESGLHHLAHARCCLAFLLTYDVHNLGADDRLKLKRLDTAPTLPWTFEYPESLGPLNP